MSKFFSDEAVEQLRVGQSGLISKAHALREKFVLHKYETERGKEYALHGFGRRLDGLAHCVERVFDLLPPESADIPQRSALVEAASNIQSFIINVSGCCDNLAWVWVFEKHVTQDDGSALPQNMVGLTSKHKATWRSLPLGFRTYLTSRLDWLKHTKSFRDSLAHRIPLYIPPHTVDHSDADEYVQLEDAIYKATLLGDVSLVESLEQKQAALMRFSPFVVHSASEGSPTALFHAQMLADFHTVEELGERVLTELNAASLTSDG